MTDEQAQGPGGQARRDTSVRRPKRERRAVLVRLDPAVHDALSRWAGDDLRSVNAQLEVILRDALRKAGRLPKDAGPLPRRGRPPRAAGADNPEG